MKLGYPHSERQRRKGSGNARCPFPCCPSKTDRDALPENLTRRVITMFNNGCGCNDIFLILILLCCCGKNDCGCYDRKGCDCCDMLVWLLLINCICGKNDCGCCK